jgi:uncharacterized protein (DUF2267 family)
MEHDEFVGLVQERARLASSGEAERAIHATLNILRRQLLDDQAEHLAAQLPLEIATYLREDATSSSFGLYEFFRRVARLEGVILQDAVHHARAVISVLQEAVAPDAMQRVREQLPDDWFVLFESGNQGKMDVLE